MTNVHDIESHFRKLREDHERKLRSIYWQTRIGQAFIILFVIGIVFWPLFIAVLP